MVRRVDIDLEKLKYLYEQTDAKNAEIANELGCSVATMSYTAKKHGFVRYSKRKSRSITKELLEDLYVNQKLTLTEVGEKLGISKGVTWLKVKNHALKDPKSSIKIPIEELQKYTDEGLSQKEMSKIYNCSENVIWARMKKYGIKARSIKRDIPLDELEDYYTNKKLPIPEIAKIYNCSRRTISTRLEKMGLKEHVTRSGEALNKEELRSLIESGLSYEDISKQLGVSESMVGDTARRYHIKKRTFSESLPYEKLYDMYITKGISINEISNLIGYSEGTIKYLLEKYKIKRKEHAAKKNILKVEDSDISSLYIDQGLTIEEVSEKLSAPRNTVRRVLHENNAVRKSPWLFIDEKVMKELYLEQGMSILEIANKFGCPRSTIANKVHKYNLNEIVDSEKRNEMIKRAHKAVSLINRSAGEKEIESMYSTNFINDHSVLRMELDLWYPDKRIAVEYNGDFYHSSMFKQINTHLTKTTLCENDNIYLINIFERFWKKKSEKPKIINILDNVLAPERLMSVEGTIKEVSNNEAKEFIGLNCISPYRKADINIGTYNEDKLLNMLTLKVLGDGDYEIVNFCSKIGYIENYESLVEYVIQTLNPKSILVSVDRRYYNGELFKSVGFTFVSKSKADYEYVYGLKSISKDKYHKNKEKYSKYYKVYDCGKITLEWQAN